MESQETEANQSSQEANPSDDSYEEELKAFREELKSLREASTVLLNAFNGMKKESAARAEERKEKEELLELIRKELEEEKNCCVCLENARLGEIRVSQSEARPVASGTNERVVELVKELAEKEKKITELSSVVASLRGKEAECSVQKGTIDELEKEVENLHTSIQKKEAKKNEEVMKVENRLSFAEQSLEAYKKEMETFLKDKLNLEAEKKAACEKAEALQSHFEVVTRCVNEL